jgi:hypothetical protein
VRLFFVLFSFFSFVSTGGWTQGLLVVRQGLYFLSSVPSPFIYFSYRVSLLPMNGLRPPSSYLHIPHSWDCRYVLPHQLVLAKAGLEPQISYLPQACITMPGLTPCLFFFLFDGTGIWTQSLLGRLCTTWAIPLGQDLICKKKKIFFCSDHNKK